MLSSRWTFALLAACLAAPVAAGCSNSADGGTRNVAATPGATASATDSAAAATSTPYAPKPTSSPAYDAVPAPLKSLNDLSQKKTEEAIGCLQGLGWNVTPGEHGYSAKVSQEQQPRFDADEAACNQRLGVSAVNDLAASDDVVNSFYDVSLKGADCLRAQGVTISSAPPREQFAADFRAVAKNTNNGKPYWMPQAEVPAPGKDGMTQERYNELMARCPAPGTP